MLCFCWTQDFLTLSSNRRTAGRHAARSLATATTSADGATLVCHLQGTRYIVCEESYQVGALATKAAARRVTRSSLRSAQRPGTKTEGLSFSDSVACMSHICTHADKENGQRHRQQEV